MGKLVQVKLTLCLARIGKTTISVIKIHLETHISLKTKINMELFLNLLNIFSNSYNINTNINLQYIAHSSKYTMKSCLISSKTRNIPNHWLLEKISLLEFLSKVKVSMLSLMHKNALCCLSAERRIESQDKLREIYIHHAHILYSNC